MSVRGRRIHLRVDQKSEATPQNNFFTTKSPRKPQFSRTFGAAGRIRTADLILTKRLLNFFLTIFRTLWPYSLQSACFPSLLETKVSVHSAAFCGWLCGQGGGSSLHDLTVCTKVVNAPRFYTQQHLICIKFLVTSFMQVRCKLYRWFCSSLRMKNSEAADFHLSTKKAGI